VEYCLYGSIEFVIGGFRIGVAEIRENFLVKQRAQVLAGSRNEKREKRIQEAVVVRCLSTSRMIYLTHVDESIMSFFLISTRLPTTFSRNSGSSSAWCWLKSVMRSDGKSLLISG